MNLSLPLKRLFLQYLCAVIVCIYYFELAFIFQFLFNSSLSFNNFVKCFVKTFVILLDKKNKTSLYIYKYVFSFILSQF